MTTDYEAEVKALYDAIDSLSDEFSDYLAEKCDQAVLNWLRIYGIPKTPNEVWQIFSVLYRGLPANLIKDGKVVPSEGVLVSDEVKAERQAKRNETQLSFSDLFSKDEVAPAFGQYL